MKRLSTISMALLLLTTSAMAQSPNKKLFFGKSTASPLKQSRQLTHRLMRANANTANKSTATYQRMIGYSDYEQDQNGQVVIYDSASLSYTGMNGSEYDYNSMSIGNFDPLFGAILPGNKLMFQASTLDIYPNTVTTTPDEAYTISYDNDDNVTEIYGTVSSGPDTRILMTYNNSHMIRCELLNANGPDWDTLYRRILYYYQDEIQADSLMENQNNIWNTVCKYTYMYNVNDKVYYLSKSELYNGYMINTQQSYYLYNVNEQITRAEYTYNPNTPNETRIKDTFMYTLGFDFYTTNEGYNFDMQNFVYLPLYYTQRVLNTDMKPVVANTFDWNWQGMGSWDSVIHETYTYDTNNNPIHDSLFNYTNGVRDTDPSFVQHLYYEDYEDLKVGTNSRKVEVTVYPNPATDVIMVNNSANAPMQLQVVNALGQTVKKARSTGNAKLSIGDLAAGSYWLTVSDTRGNKLHTQMIVKQ